MHKPLILLVEDNDALREGMSETLELNGYRTVKASNGQEGLEVLREVRPDLIISDIMMPKVDGYAFHEAVAAQPESSPIPFLFLTAKSGQADVRKGLRAGVDAYLTKPIDLEDLLLHVQNKLSRFAEIREQALRQLEVLQSQIVAMMSHELRTPLTYIQVYADLLAESSEKTPPEEIRSFLEGLQKGSRRLCEVVEDLLRLVHLDAGIFEQEFAQHSAVAPAVGPIVNLVAEQLEPAATERGYHIRVELADALPPVRLQERQVGLALTELVENAIRFSRDPGSEILIRGYQSRDRVCVDVVDQGIGIAAKDIPHVFERFRQFDRDVHEQRGIGVGLATGRGLAQANSGDIEVESQLGTGSTFTLWLPAAH